MAEDDPVIASDKTLEQEFMHWQCKSRLFAARQAAGYPLDEAKPLVCYGEKGDTGVELTILILKHQLDHLTAQYKHNAIKSVDPIERFEWVVKQVSSEYYKKADTFQSTMTALCQQKHPLHKGYCTKASAAWPFVPAVKVSWCLLRWLS